MDKAKDGVTKQFWNFALRPKDSRSRLPVRASPVTVKKTVDSYRDDGQVMLVQQKHRYSDATGTDPKPMDEHRVIKCDE